MAHSIVSKATEGGLKATGGHIGVPMGAGTALGGAYAGYLGYQGLKKMVGKMRKKGGK